MTRKKRGSDLSSQLLRLSRRLDRKTGGGLLQAKTSVAWRSIAGPTVLSHTTGEHLRQGELVVLVDSPVWATELSALSEHYRERINQEIGEEAVRAVRFSVSSKVEVRRKDAAEEHEASAFYDQDKVPSVALSAQERAQIEASASAIDDEKLREAVVRATIADLEWKKGLAAARRRQAPREGP